MRAYIVHLFTICGGGERVSLEIARVLRDRGFTITYVTNSGTVLRRCAELFGLPGDYHVIESSSFMEKLLSLTGRFYRYRRLLLMSAAYERVLEFKREGLMIDTGTNNPVGVDITYIHYPVVLGTVQSNALHWRVYNWLVARKAQGMVGEPGLVLTNSSWTAKLIKEVYGLDSLVLHPPVDIEYFAYDGRPKDRVIVTVSRFTPEKKLHLLPRIAPKLPDYEWFLVGTTGSTLIEKNVSRNVLTRVLEERGRCGATNFHVLADLPRRELRNLLQRAAFYVHPEFPEHFGIAVVEAMAAGAVPIVYRDGGAWTDIVSKLNSEFGYSSVEEIPALIKRLEKQPGLDELKWRVSEYARNFGAEAFRRQLLTIIEDYLERG